MRTGAAALAAAALVALGPMVAGVARAQDQPAPAGSTSPDDAWRKYDAAFEALAQGRRDPALRLLEELVAADPAHPAARRAAELLSAVAAQPPPDEEDLRRERPTRAARAELALFQTLHGIAVGAELCVLLNCSDASSALATVTLLGGVGLASSLLATPGGIRPGTTALLDSGVEWGAWNAVAVATAGDFGSHGVAGSLLLAQGLGLGAGGALASTLRPTAGQVSLANTVGLWAGLLTLFARGADDFSGTRRSIMLSLLGTSDAGLLAGSLLAARFPTSRGHALLIDAGGAAGAVLALGTVAIVGGNGTSGHTYFLAMIPGTLIGLGASAYFTRNWDAPNLPIDLAVAPLPDGHGATAGVAGRF